MGMLHKFAIKGEQSFNNAKNEVPELVSDIERFKWHKSLLAMDRLLLSRITHFESEMIDEKAHKR